MSELSKAISLIIKGEVVVIPTEASYCYVVDPFNQKAVEKLKELKDLQNIDQEITILIGDLQDLTSLVESIDSKEEKKVMKYWPGENSIVFSYPSNILNKELLYKNKNVLLRLPAEDFVLEVLHGVGQPLACINIYDEQVLIRNSLHFKNSEKHYLKVTQSLSGNLPNIIE